MSGDGIEDIKNTLDMKTIANNNYDDISQNNFTSLNMETLLKSSNNVNNEENKKYNGLTDNELNENQIQICNEKNIKNKILSKNKKNTVKNNTINNDITEEPKVELFFDYESKDQEELSD